MIERDRLARLVEQGLSDAQIARMVRVSPRTVLRWRGHYGIASSWTPRRTDVHGLARYRQGCRCRTCRAANAAAQKAHRDASQRATGAAKSWGQPWTPDDDETLLTGAGSVADRAVRLGRTYVACRLRLDVLRRRADNTP